MNWDVRERTSSHLRNSWLDLYLQTVEKRYKLNDERAGLILGKDEPESDVETCLEAIIRF
jgi:hypothetical protein